MPETEELLLGNKRALFRVTTPEEGLPISVVAESQGKELLWQREGFMAKVIEFYVPGSYRPKRRDAEIGKGTVVVFPRAYKFMLEVVEADQIKERRRYQRVGLFAKLEDSIYKVLRSAERGNVAHDESLPSAVAMSSPFAL